MPLKLESLLKFIEKIPPVLYAYYRELLGNIVACNIPNAAAGGFCFMQFFLKSQKFSVTKGEWRSIHNGSERGIAL